MLTARLDTARFMRTLGEPLKRHVPFALSHAINKTMSAVRKDQQAQMDKYMENTPNRYTKSAPQISYSNKRDLQAFLWYGDRAAYVKTLIKGGTVVAPKRKLVEPVNVKLNKAGNIPKGFVKRNKDKPKFFIGIPRGRGNDDQYYGLWRRIGRPGYGKNGRARGKLQLIVSMRRGRRQQEPIFPAGELAAAEFQSRILRQIPASFRYAFRTSDKRFKNLNFR